MAARSKDLGTFQSRIVVVLGKTGAGKSTVANQVLGDQEGTFQVATSFTSVTQEVECRRVLLKAPDREDITYSVKVVDTQGLFDTKKGKAGNKAVMNAVKEFFLKEAPEGVNLILFVCREGRWTEEEQSVFDYIMKHFKDEIKGFSALIFTGCENHDERTREKIAEEFRNSKNPKQAGVASLMGKGIYTVGFPDLSSAPPVLKSGYEGIAVQDQEKLRQLIFSCHDKHLSKEFIDKTFWEKLWCLS